MDEEIREEKLDSPLVVHKKSDASYQETAIEVDMSVTHDEDNQNAPTLERHRFRKKKKKNKGGIWVIIGIAVIIVAVISALMYSGKLPIDKTEETTQPVTLESTTENRFKNTIVVKGTYVFYDGEEVDGVKGLESKIKYLDDEQKNITVINEHAQNEFLNYDILPLLETYHINYTSTFMESTGLISQYETTTAQTTVTTTAATTNSSLDNPADSTAAPSTATAE